MNYYDNKNISRFYLKLRGQFELKMFLTKYVDVFYVSLDLSLGTF